MHSELQVARRASDPDDLRKLCGAAGNNAAMIGCY
jgi:hypothetical protein